MMDTAGEQTFTANYAGDNNHNPASNVSLTVNVKNKSDVSGSITFDENGDANKDMAYIKIMSDGAFKFVGTQKTDGTFTAA